MGSRCLASVRHRKWHSDGMETTIDRAGRMVIPKSIREAAGLKPGMSLRIDYRDGKIEIERKSLKSRLIPKGSILV